MTVQHRQLVAQSLIEAANEWKNHWILLRHYYINTTDPLLKFVQPESQSKAPS